LQLSTKFFIETLNFTKVGEKPEYPAIFVSDGTVMVTLWQSNDPDNAVLFDRKNNIGLHHLALSLNNSEDLDTNTSNPKKSS
jgi:catechol-2,3-dioxygenase